MNIEKGIYWDEMCNPICTDRCACEVKRCWAKDWMKFRPGLNPSPDENGVGWYPHRLNKIKVTGPAKVYAMCWLGDIGWPIIPIGNLETTIDTSVFINNKRILAGLEPHTYLFLTKFPVFLIDKIQRAKPIGHVGTWFGTTITGGNIADIFRWQCLTDHFDSWKLWLSCEPLLSPVKIPKSVLARISQVIVGGDSRSHENTDLDAVRSIVEQCQAASVPVFVKQLTIDHKCTTDITLWPAELRVRELEWRKENEN